MRNALLISATIVALTGGSSAALAQASSGQTPGQRMEQPTDTDSGRVQPGQRKPGSAGVSGHKRVTHHAARHKRVTRVQTPGQRAEQPNGPDSGRTAPP